MKKRRRRRSPGFDSDFPALTVAQARDFLRDEPNVYHAWLYLGVAHGELWHYDEACKALRRAIKLAPNQRTYGPKYKVARALQMAYTEVGTLYQRKGKFQTAETCFRRAVEVNPRDADGYNYLGFLLTRAGRLMEADRVLQRGTRCRIGCVDEAYYKRGLVLRALERFGEAEKCFQKAIELDPKCTVTKNALRDLVERRKFEEARKRTISWRRCMSALSRGRAACVIALARHRLVEFPDHPSTWSLLGKGYCWTARYGEARAAFARNMKLHAASMRHYAHSDLGWMYQCKGNFRAAAMWFQRAIEVAPRRAGYRVSLGALLADQGRLREAGDAFRRALRCPDVNVAEAHLHLGLVLRARERYAKARESLTIAADNAEYAARARKALKDIDRRLAWKYRPEWIEG